MSSIKEAAAQFLAAKRVAVTGVSRTAAKHGSNVVYQRLKQRGYTVFSVNPNAEKVEGDAAYPDLTSIPGGVDAVVIGTKPERGRRHDGRVRGARDHALLDAPIGRCGQRLCVGDRVRPRPRDHCDRWRLPPDV